MSDPESVMARHLQMAGLPAPERQHRFWPQRRFAFDFAWPDKMVALEVEGGTYVGGRHVRPAGFEKDCEKYSEAAIRGWTVVRVTSGMVTDGRAIRLVMRALGYEAG